MRFFICTVCFLLFSNLSYSRPSAPADTVEINKLNQLGYDYRLIDADQTLRYAEKALKSAKAINYINGMAEAYRIKGIGQYYRNQNEIAIENYLTSLTLFSKSKNKEGEAKVNNNIGNLYRDVDYDKALEYFHQSLIIARQLSIKDLIAGLYLNIGTIYQKKKNYNLALINYEKSTELFNDLGIVTGKTQCLQNLGVVYRNLNQLDKAEFYSTSAIKSAKENDLNFIVAGTNLTLTSIYISTNRFPEAIKSIEEGIAYSRIIKDSRLEYDYKYISYELESKRKNYQKAIEYLKEVYKQDSLTYKSNESVKIGLLHAKYRQSEKQKQNELTIQRQKNDRNLFWASTAVASLAIFAIFLLFRNNRKSAKTNHQLTLLNEEVNQQKEDLDRINHNLEEIIDERTRDLKIKNNKLSEYSSHLSHQIRGPVATIKGLLILETDNLIEQEEFVEKLQICIQDIDNKILTINESLNNHEKDSLYSKMN